MSALVIALISYRAKILRRRNNVGVKAIMITAYGSRERHCRLQSFVSCQQHCQSSMIQATETLPLQSLVAASAVDQQHCQSSMVQAIDRLPLQYLLRHQLSAALPIVDDLDDRNVAALELGCGISCQQHCHCRWFRRQRRCRWSIWLRHQLSAAMTTVDGLDDRDVAVGVLGSGISCHLCVKTSPTVI